MGTRFEKREDGRVDKPPYRVVPGRPIIKADKTNPENWATYSEALAACERGDVDAVGFVFTDEDPFFVVDLDDVVNTETGEIQPSASEVIHTVGSYTELSCSGSGVHIVGIGTKPHYAGCRSRKMGFTAEVYTASRFMVMTGQNIGGELEPQNRQDALEWLCQRLWIKHERFNSRPQAESHAADLEDEALLDRARNARTGAKFVRLFDQGDTSEFGSQSEADFALMNMLVFWCAGDPVRMAHLFEMSALYRRDKHRKYVRDSVAKALASYKGAFYHPKDVKKAREKAAEDPLAPYLALLLDPSQWKGRKGPSAYKAFAAAVMLAAEYGVVGDAEELRIGADVRRLSEVAGMSDKTMRCSALPYLMQEMKLLSWRKGKKGKAGVIVLKNPTRATYRNKIPTHFTAVGCAGSFSDPETALQNVRQLIRMRGGHNKKAPLLRLGMLAMFITVVMTSQQRRGYTRAELAEATGRRARDLDWNYTPKADGDVRVPPIERLKSAGIIDETPDGLLWLTGEFSTQWQRHLDLSGITYSEHRQREKHKEQREKKAKIFPTDKQERPLKGGEHNARILKRDRERERDRWIEEQRKKVGTTVATFVADELKGATAMNFHAMRLRFQERGGNATELWRAVHNGPWCFYREADGDLYVRPDETPPDDPPAYPTDEERIKGLVGQGMSPKWARAEVLSEEMS